jgi:hypothetical protein
MNLQENSIFVISVKCEYFLRVYYLGKEASVFAETFSIYYGPWDLRMGKISGRNFFIRFFPKYFAIGQKSSKTVIALEGKPTSAYPFRLFLLSLGLTHGQDITSTAISKLVTLPRKSRLEKLGLIHLYTQHTVRAEIIKIKNFGL